MLKIRRSHDRLIFNMGLPIPGKESLYMYVSPMLDGAQVAITGTTILVPYLHAKSFHYGYMLNIQMISIPVKLPWILPLKFSRAPRNIQDNLTGTDFQRRALWQGTYYKSSPSNGYICQQVYWASNTATIRSILVSYQSVITLRPRQNGRRFAADIFKCIFVNENLCILIQISLKFVPKYPIDSNPALV